MGTASATSSMFIDGALPSASNHCPSNTIDSRSDYLSGIYGLYAPPKQGTVHLRVSPLFRNKQINDALMSPDQFKNEMIGLLPRLRRFALSLTKSGPDADDLLQDACTSALQRWQQYDPAQPMDRWMFRIVRNHWVSEIRKRQVRQGQGQVPAEESTELRLENNADMVLTAKQVSGKVSELPSDLSQPLLLVCAEGYSYKEASELLAIPIGTVMSRIHRARKLLAASFSEAEVVAQ